MSEYAAQPHPIIEDGIARLRTYWPQSHYQGRNDFGQYLIVVPSVRLPKGWITYTNDKAVECTICTVLFIAPAGFPAASPSNFYTDIEMRLAKPKDQIAKYTHTPGKQSNAQYLGRLGWPQWASTCQWWKWTVQMWDPNYSSLFTYMKVIQQRFHCLV